MNKIPIPDKKAQLHKDMPQSNGKFTGFSWNMVGGGGAWEPMNTGVFQYVIPPQWESWMSPSERFQKCNDIGYQSL